MSKTTGVPIAMSSTSPLPCGDSGTQRSGLLPDARGVVITKVRTRTAKALTCAAKSGAAAATDILQIFDGKLVNVDSVRVQALDFFLLFHETLHSFMQAQCLLVDMQAQCLLVNVQAQHPLVNSLSRRWNDG